MKYLQRLVFAVVLLLATASMALAVNVGLQDVVAALETPFKPNSTGLPPLETVTAYFFQRSTIATQNRELRGDGEMFVKMATPMSPLMFRFDYFRPVRQEIVSDGQLLWTYLPENRQAIRSELAGVFPTTGFNPTRDRAVNFLQGLGRLSKDFTITFASGSRFDHQGNFILELQPNRSMASIRRLLVVVQKEAVYSRVDQARYPFKPEYNFPILATTSYDHQGNSNTMEFSNVRVNGMLSDSLFSFSPPAHVQVVRPPRSGD